MRHPDWQTEDGSIRLFCGDALELLAELPDNSIDAVVTDPPYMIGAISTGSENSKCGTWMDMVNAAVWFREWIGECRRALKRSGYLATCCNWRTIPTLTCAFAKLSWPVTSCVVWDKQWIGTAYKNAFRPTYELAMCAAMPEAEIIDRCASDVFRGDKWLASQCGDSDHPAEKPVDFMSYLVSHLSQHGGTILDPFMGSATTAIAAMQCGRRFVGIEGDERHWQGLVGRITDELGKLRLFEKPPKIVQRSLIDGDAP